MVSTTGEYETSDEAVRQLQDRLGIELDEIQLLGES